ncbi:hypothetical protein ACFFRR_003664 [Megaselia abdita]
MAFSYSCLISQRVLLPLILVLSSLYRPVGISFVYLLMFFVSPFIPIATQRNFKVTISANLLLLVALSTLVILCHIGLQLTLLGIGKDAIAECSVTARLLKHIGFISFFDQKPAVITLWLLPDLAVLATSIAVFLTVRSAVRPKPENVEQGEAFQQTVSNSSDTSLTKRSTYLLIPNFDRLINISPLFCLATLFFAGALRPSVQGGFYFLVFLLCGSYWATFKSLQRGFAIFMRFVAVVLVLHIIAIVSYQLEWSQEYLSSEQFVARLLALEPLVNSGCHKYIEYNTKYNADSYLSPIFILVAYYTLILSSNNLIKKRVSICRDRLPEPNETTPLVRHHTTNLRTATRRSLSQPIQMDSLDTNQNEETTSSFFDQICYGIISVAGFIYQNSYIFTNILMMTWSIIYHSWLGFVFLLWANVMWMIPNQRKAMMRSSPIIVLYAEVLLIIQYLYCMNLNEEELPTKVNTTGINLEQIGLIKISASMESPFIPLVAKSAMLLMFWVTLRQFFKEKRDRRRTSTIADMVAPLQMAVGAASIGHKEKKKSSKFLKKMGDMLKNFLVRLWIWLLIFVIFLCAITGTQMTAFRVFYMALFLFFLLVFQLSSKIWVKVMYGFWIFLIIYAMTILTLIYTYQFDKFSTYWEQYLNVSKTLQTDIGLETYKTKELLLHLLPPTLIVILTVIQVHYFHKRFVASLIQQSLKQNPSSSVDLDGVNAQSSTQLDESSETYLSESATSKFQNIKNVSKRFCQRLRSITKNLAISFKEIVWRFLELHLIKGVYLTAFLCCIHELCILHIPAIFLCIIGYISRGDIKLYTSKFISLIFCIITLTKMIYQVQYIDHKIFFVNCTNNMTGNNAEWFGLQKISANNSLVQIIKPYIAYMMIATLHSVVSLRQSRMRTLFEDPVIKSPLVLFPNIKRIDAEKNISGALKYLMNYGFYKFGLEICFIAIVGLAAYRKDVISIFYIFWLCILIPLNRRSCAKAWSTFLFLTGVIIILQYLLFVGLPPGLCLEYPWTKTDYSEPLQAWALMPGDKNIKHNPKLIFDFIVFMLIYRQKKVFDIEIRNVPNYPGGSNKSVVSDIENLGLQQFENPTSDFLSSIRDWLDVIKNAILCGFFWITLAVVFLAGTNIGDILALGYLIGSFIFLWQGSDFYLRPIRNILHRWHLLLAYNVFNITIKVILQFPACIYMKVLSKKICFLIHLLGIKCQSVEMKLDEGVEGTCSPINVSYSFLVWDAVCFAFIIFQLRIFKSHYFCHIINDTKANTLLASRGAEIIEDLRKKQIEHRQKHEQEVLHKIKKKMEKIRATQNKLRRITDKPTHFDEKGKKEVRKPLVSHAEAIRAGDYYMFDDVDEKFELDMIDDETDFLESEGKISEIDKKIAQRKTILDTEVKGKSSLSGLTPGSQKRHSAKEIHIDDTKSQDNVDASTSTAPAKQPDEEETGEEEEITTRNPIVRLLEGLLVSIAVRLNRFSRNYRYVMKILAEEKKTLKESKGFEKLGKLGVASIWTPLNVLRMQVSSLVRDDEPQTSSQLISPYTHQTDTNTDDTDSNSDIIHDTQLVQSTPRKAIGSQGSIAAKPSTTGTGDFSFEEEFADKDHHIVIQVLISFWYAVLSNTDLICYTVVFISQCVSGNQFSLPLPIMVFLWGTLSLPRPTKTFWVTLIGYTQALVLLKCIYQFNVIWKEYLVESKNSHSAASIIGLELNSEYTTYDLILLLVLFFHRFILKSQGLWKSENKEEHQEGAYIMRDELPDDGDVDSQQSLDDTILVTKGDQTLALGRTEQIVAEDQINIQLNTTNQQPGEYIPGIVKLTSTKYFSTIRNFFNNIVNKARLPTDVYAFMFLCDFINFFVLLFGFTAFGSQQGESGEGGVQTYLAENKVPVPFLIMLLVQFLLIITDRALYLRKALIYKIIFHFVSVIGIHIWMFFVIPVITERKFNSLAPPIFFYITKCFYFLWSAYQIKCGFPKRILGNVLTKSFSLVNMILFKVYMNLPFLYELRTILDWVCTDTTMTLFDWLKMEDIFSDIYFIKCGRQMETDFPVVRAQKKAIISKLFLGGIMILMIVVAIWGPLCLFALANAVGISNIPISASVNVRVGSYDPLYQTNTEENIHTFTPPDYNTFAGVYIGNKHATTFLSNYDSSDIAAVQLPGNSSTVWEISPPDMTRLLDDLSFNKTLTLRFQYTFERKGGKGDPGKVIGTHLFYINETFGGREALVNMLQGTSPPDEYIVIPNMLPKFLKLLNTGAMYEVSDLKPAANISVVRSLKLRLHPVGGVERNETKGIYWWEVKENCTDDFYNTTLVKLPYASCQHEIVLYTFNDRRFPSHFDFLTAGGIIGLYTTFVILISKVLKGFLSGQNRRIMFEDLPYVDRVLQLCLDIYLVREALEFALEEDLFAKLLFLYRSPETMIKWTRPKEEINDDETDTDSIRSSKGSGHRKQD